MAANGDDFNAGSGRHEIHDSAYSWTRLAITLLIAAVGNVGMWAIVVVMPFVQREFDVARADGSLPYTLTMMGFALGSLMIGKWIDQFGAVKSLIGATLIITVSMAGAALAPSVTVLSAWQFAIGFGAAASFGPLIADISHWFLKRRGLAVGIAASGNYVSGAIWPVLLSDISLDHSWRLAYGVMAAIVFIVVIPLAFTLRRKIPEEASRLASAQSTARAATVPFSPRALQYILGLAGIACCMAMAMPQVHIVALCVDLGFGPAVGAEMLSLMLAGGVVSRLVSGLATDYLGGVKTLLIGSVLQCIALFLYLPFDGLVSLYLVSLVFGLSQGGIVPAYAVIVREYMPAKEAGARVGFVIMATILGMALGGWITGWIYDLTSSYQWAFLNGIAWNFLNIGVMVMLLVRAKPRSPMAAA